MKLAKFKYDQKPERFNADYLQPKSKSGKPHVWRIAYYVGVHLIQDS